jgi:hypothetical protein
MRPHGYIAIIITSPRDYQTAPCGNLLFKYAKNGANFQVETAVYQGIGVYLQSLKSCRGAITFSVYVGGGSRKGHFCTASTGFIFFFGNK